MGVGSQILRRPDPVLADRRDRGCDRSKFCADGGGAESLPFGTAYAVWTGIGAVGSIIVGILIYSEPADPVRIVCLALIVAGMVGLKLNSPV